MKPSIGVVITCHNRVGMTLACLESMRSQGERNGAGVRVYLVDDASTDGTAERVAERFPETVVIPGSGELFWSGGMRVAFARAMQDNPDHYLWMNDDVVLDGDALDVLVETHDRLQAAGKPAAIVVGSMRDPVSGELTYGGVHRTSRLRPLKFDLIRPGDDHVPSETMNGNVVLIPREVADVVGNIDVAYQHSMGDFDYGLRARQAGFSVWVAPGTLGTCARNPMETPGAAPLGDELRRLRSLKGLPPSPWRTFAQRWAGPLWALYYWSPYVRRAARSAGARLPRPGAARG